MSRKSAYRLRALPGAESFAAAWDAALGMPLRKVTPPPRDLLDFHPLVHLVTFRGRYRAAWRNAADGSLLTHVWRPDRTGQGDRV
jgi:hypothetical protein